MSLTKLQRDIAGQVIQLREERILAQWVIELRNQTDQISSRISQFVMNMIQVDNYIPPQIYAYNNIFWYKWCDGAYYSPVSKRIFLPNKSRKFSYDSVTMIEEVGVLSHEVGHHVQTILHADKSLNITTKQLRIFKESQADYFAGWFVAYCVDLWFLNVWDVEKITNLFKDFWLHTWIDSLDSQIDLIYRKWNFVSVNGDYHGIRNHRRDMFHMWYEFQDISFFNDPKNFIPNNVIEIDYSVLEK